MKIEIITTPLVKAEEHQAAVNRVLAAKKFEQLKVDSFITAGYGGYSKYQTESAMITTIIKIGGSLE